MERPVSTFKRSNHYILCMGFFFPTGPSGSKAAVASSAFLISQSPFFASCFFLFFPLPFLFEIFANRKKAHRLGKMMGVEKKGKSRGNPAFSFLGRSCIEKGAAFFAADLINNVLEVPRNSLRFPSLALLYPTTYGMSTISQTSWGESLFYPKSDFCKRKLFYGLPDSCQKLTGINRQF